MQNLGLKNKRLDGQKYWIEVTLAAAKQRISFRKWRLEEKKLVNRMSLKIIE